MKEELFTIPVNEALEADGECLFCTLNKKLESDILNYVMGPSYMEEDIREETDKTGFCEKHYSQIYNAQNRLGAALILETHLRQIRKDLSVILKKEVEGFNKKKSIFTKKDEFSPAQDYIDNINDSCYACRRMDARMDSYIDTFFYLWKREPEFCDKIMNSKGFCIKHFSMLLEVGRNKLTTQSYQEFLSKITDLELHNLDIIQNDIDWFVQKFDYRYKDEPWKNSKDAVSRTILKLSSEIVE